MDADVSIIGEVDTSAHVSGEIDIAPATLVLVNSKRPYLINPSNIECVVGEWNKDKGEYGVRVFFVSGNNNWFGGSVAKNFLCDLADSGSDAETLKRRFEERVKAGPPKA